MIDDLDKTLEELFKRELTQALVNQVASHQVEEGEQELILPKADAVSKPSRSIGGNK